MTATLNARMFTVETRTSTRSVESTLTDAQAVDILARIEGDFSRDLVRQWARSARFSPKQLAWVHLLACEQLDKEARTQVEVAPVVEEQEQMDRVVEMLEKAHQHLKFPRIRLAGPDGTRYHLTLAGEKSRHPGSVNVVADEGRVWLGRISTDGLWFPGSSAQGHPALLETLRALAVNPAEVAKGYGHLTGQCCFCGLGLTDPRSVSAGYGPVCAANWSLQW